jgi:hypothetical protein
MIIRWLKHQIEVIVTGKAVEITVDEDDLFVEDYGDVLGERFFEPEEYTLGPGGEKIVAAPPVASTPSTGSGAVGSATGEQDSRSAEMAGELANRGPERNELVGYIEAHAGGNGNGTPDLGGGRSPKSGSKAGSGGGSGRKAPGDDTLAGKILAWMASVPEFSQNKLADRTGLHFTTVSHHLNGAKITKISLEKYAAAFGVSVEDFLKGPWPQPVPAESIPVPVATAPAESIPIPLASMPAENNPAVAGGAPSRSRGKTGNLGACGNGGLRKKKPEEPVVLDPLVAAVCEACKENVGDVECGKCLITKGLQKARVQETPGQITHNVKLAVCAGCVHHGGVKCRTCRMGVYWAAVEYYNAGKSIGEAAREAESDYQAEITAKR